MLGKTLRDRCSFDRLKSQKSWSCPCMCRSSGYVFFWKYYYDLSYSTAFGLLGMYTQDPLEDQPSIFWRSWVCITRPCIDKDCCINRLLFMIMASVFRCRECTSSCIWRKTFGCDGGCKSWLFFLNTSIHYQKWSGRSITLDFSCQYLHGLFTVCALLTDILAIRNKLYIKLKLLYLSFFYFRHSLNQIHNVFDFVLVD